MGGGGGVPEKFQPPQVSEPARHTTVGSEGPRHAATGGGARQRSTPAAGRWTSGVPAREPERRRERGGRGGRTEKEAAHRPPSRAACAAAAPPGPEARKDARTSVPARPPGYLGPNLLGLPVWPQLPDEAQGAGQDVVLLHVDPQARNGGGRAQGARRLPTARAGGRPLLHAP